jgi:Flp pilus assembly secretin CpaC
MLDVRILAVSKSTSNKLGIGEPNHFQLFTLAPLLRQLAQQPPDLQQQILQLFEQGGLNAVLQSGQLSSLLGQLGQGQNPLNTLLQNPFVVFGGGATLMALTVPALTADLTRNESAGRTIEDAWLHASSDQSATLKIGSRYPIANATFAPIFLNSQISKVIGNGSYLQPFPSFTYEDLGLVLKLTPHLESDRLIGLKVEAQVRALTGASNDGVPILSNRKLVTQLNLKNGESAILAGLFDKQETRSLSGLPFLGQVPGLGQFFSTLKSGQNSNQLLILVTPHVLQSRNVQTAEIWLPPGSVSTTKLPPLKLPQVNKPAEGKQEQPHPRQPQPGQSRPGQLAPQSPSQPPPPSGMAPNRVPSRLPGQNPSGE